MENTQKNVVFQKPEWINVSYDKNYSVNFEIVNNRLLICRAKGVCCLAGVKKALKLADKIIKENFDNGAYAYIEDFKELKSIDNDARKFYISHMQKQSKMLGLIYYNVSSVFKLSIKLGSRLNLINFKVFIAENLTEAITLSDNLFIAHQVFQHTEFNPKLQSKKSLNDDEVVSKIQNSGVLYQSENYYTHYNIINNEIFHTFSKGILKAADVLPTVQANREVIKKNWGDGKSYYFVANVKGTRVEKESRKQYQGEMLKLYNQYPFKMYIFCQANRFVRAAINLSKFKVPFPVKIVNCLDDILKLVADDKKKSKKTVFPFLKGKRENVVSERFIKENVDELLGFLGSIDWEKDGIKDDYKQNISPLFQPIVEGLDLIKMELDELYKKRKIEEKQKTDLKKQLDRSMKMEAVGTVAGGVAHDLNNILGGMVSYPEILLMEMPKDSPLREYVQNIYKSGLRAATIVQDLLTLTRRGVSVSELVNMNDIIRDFFISPEFNKMKGYHSNVEYKTNLENNLGMITGSPVHLQKTIMNLISNAVEAMPDGGIVTVTTKKSKSKKKDGIQYMMLKVSDEGIGIPEEDLDRIFEPFYTKKKMGRSGTGLGMAVVWNTVQDHNGFLDVKSELNKGSSFLLYFPVSKNLNLPKAKKPKYENIMGDGDSVLVVDDVSEQREVATAILKRLGYRVEAVASGEEAIEYIADKPVDILILDMIMDPGIDGLETYKRILTLNPDQKAIISSGFSEPENMKEVIQLGRVKYLKKPYTIQQIGMIVKEVLESLE